LVVKNIIFIFDNNYLKGILLSLSKVDQSKKKAMKNKKLKLEDLKVKSFVTSEESKQIVGGAGDPTGRTNCHAHPTCNICCEYEQASMIFDCSNYDVCQSKPGLGKCPWTDYCDYVTCDKNGKEGCDIPPPGDSLECDTYGCM